MLRRGRGDDGVSRRELRCRGDAGGDRRATNAPRCTAFPTMFIAELDHPDFASYDLSSLRTGIMAGAPCPIETMRRVIERMHMREVTIAYGMTETSPISFQSRIDDPDRTPRRDGGPHPSPCRGQDRRRKSAASCRWASAGELCTRGYCVMRGYWEDDERTRGSDRSPPAGCIPAISPPSTSRAIATSSAAIKDMLIRGGENVYPREIEEFLLRHPKVQAVQVFGVPDQRLGEEVCAFDRAEARSVGDGGGDRRLLPGSDLPLQSAAPHPLRAGIPNDGHRQAAEIHDARTDDARNRRGSANPT